jgi:hypothetical protein
MCRSKTGRQVPCNNLQNVGATTYKKGLQQPTFLLCNFMQKGLAKNRYTEAQPDIRRSRNHS